MNNEFVKEIAVSDYVPIFDVDLRKVLPFDNIEDYVFDIAFALEFGKEPSDIRSYKPKPYAIVTNPYDLYLYTVEVFQKFRSMGDFYYNEDSEKIETERAVSIFLNLKPYTISLIRNYKKEYKLFLDNEPVYVPVTGLENEYSIAFEYNAFIASLKNFMDEDNESKNKFLIKTKYKYSRFSSTEILYNDYISYLNPKPITDQKNILPSELNYMIREIYYSRNYYDDIHRNKSLGREMSSLAYVENNAVDGIFYGTGFVL